MLYKKYMPQPIMQWSKQRSGKKVKIDTQEKQKLKKPGS